MKIDFHVLEETTNQRAWQYTCQLVEKSHAEQRKVFIYTNSAADAERMDKLLWTYRDDSFIPHDIVTQLDDYPPPVQISHLPAPAAQQDILINLSENIPAFLGQFKQVIEIVFTDPLVQQLARERFKQYRDQGFELNTHKIKASE